jgi:hypothetical protein
MELDQHSPQQLPRIWKGLFYPFLGIHEHAKLFLWKFRVVIGEHSLNEIFIGDFI